MDKSRFNIEKLALMQAARFLLEDPNSWVKGSNAINGGAVSCVATSASAISWCAVGALLAFWSDRRIYSTVLNDAISALNDVCGQAIVGLNDAEDTRHAIILQMYDKAIEKVASEIDTH